ncbi:response regulator transcription factor [Arcticibacter sp. MXS-1]|uniref:response regulator transcription factor n=1 Tax=Arcticibacter sp. MXS-1 TaxID=3341726 RepID=UPI0035A91855
MKAHTQAELQEAHRTKLFMIGKDLSKNLLRIEDVGDCLPGSVMVQDLSIMVNTYMNKYGCDFLRRSSEDLSQMGSDYFTEFFPSDEIRILKRELIQFVKEDDSTKMHSFYQRVRPDSHHDYTWYFTTSRLYPTAISDNPYKMIHIAVQANMLSYAGRKLDKLVEDDLFIRKNLRRFSLLSAREKEIICEIVEGRSSAEIAEKLFISIHTVNAHRKNIIHKLEVNSLSQLIRFAVCFALI